MEFVKLTRRDDRAPIFVAARHVTAVQNHVNMPGTTLVRMLDGEHHWVHEAPDAVVALLEGALAGRSAGG
jgi:hypothetical protein